MWTLGRPLAFSKPQWWGLIFEIHRLWNQQLIVLESKFTDPMAISLVWLCLSLSLIIKLIKPDSQRKLLWVSYDTVKSQEGEYVKESFYSVDLLKVVWIIRFSDVESDACCAVKNRMKLTILSFEKEPECRCECEKYKGRQALALCQAGSPKIEWFVIKSCHAAVLFSFSYFWLAMYAMCRTKRYICRYCFSWLERFLKGAASGVWVVCCTRVDHGGGTSLAFLIQNLACTGWNWGILMEIEDGSAAVPCSCT